MDDANPAGDADCLILLIDDDRDDRELAGGALRTAFPTAGIVEASDAAGFRDALDAADRAGEPFDVIVTDCALRWADGLSVLREVRERLPDVPVLMFTGSGTEEICAEAMKAGLDDYIVKSPRHYVRLPIAVKAALERRTLARELRRRDEENARQREELTRANESLNRQIAERTQVAEQRAQQLRLLASELTKAEERERRRLAQMLHDDLQQMLVAARMHLNAIPPGAGPERTAEGVRHVDDLLDRSVRLSKNLTLRFCPPVLYDGGLAPALEWLGRQSEDEHGLEVEIDVDPTAEPEAQDTRSLLYNACRELLFNVVKHAGVPRAKITMHHAGESDVQVSVCDEGKGFGADRAKSIGRSSGFGLFSIRERLELIGGRMEIETIADEGSCVRLYAPIFMSEDERQGATVDSTVIESILKGETPAPRKPAKAPPGPTIKVLLADDHRIIRASLAGLLKSQPGIEVVGQAADGREVIELARRLRPDVIVMDVTMPYVDGVEATRTLIGEMPGLSVIGLSMHEKEDTQQAMRAAGASRYLTKDGPPELLVAAIRSSVRRKTPPVGT